MKESTTRVKRRKQTAEFFTPAWLVNEMLDKLNEYGPESFEKGKTFLDPSCGTGNILVEILKKLLKLHNDPLNALRSIYGVDIMQDNILECRERLLNLVEEWGLTEDIKQDIKQAVIKNIVWTPLEVFSNGALDYDFEFEGNGETIKSGLLPAKNKEIENFGWII